jgi:S1-C subfamily serine protease
MTYPLGGDLIASIDGLQLYSIEQLRDAIAAKKPGDDVKLVVYRGNQQRTVTVKLGRQPSTS